jgi:2-haloacid dehalogenase
MALSALLMDAYGTLWDVHTVVKRCDGFWPGNGAKLSQLWRSKQLEYTWLRSLMNRYVPFSQVTRDALGYACSALGLELTEAQAAALMDEYRRLGFYADSAQALDRLSSMKRAILTNGSPDMIEPLVKHSGASFDAVLSVDEAKIFKPAPAAYAIAVAKFGAAPGNLGFVTSNCWDAMGAKSFGFRVYWINRLGAPADALGFRPDAILKTLGELPEVLL